MINVFYTRNTDDSDELDDCFDNRTKVSSVADYVEEAFNFAKSAATLPEWLININYNEFDEDYITLGLSDGEAVKEAYKIGRVYNDYDMYAEAVERYHVYMEYIETTYGDVSTIKSLDKNGFKLVYIPPYPKLIAKRRNKIRIAAGVAISETQSSLQLEPDLLKILTSIAVAKMEPMEVVDESVPLTEEELRAKALVEKDQAIQQRRRDVYRVQGSASQSQCAITALLSGDVMGKYANANSELNKDTIAEIIADGELADKLDPEFDDENCVVISKQFMYLDGHLKQRPDPSAKKVKVLEMLLESGFNVLDRHNKGIQSKSIRALDAKYRNKFASSMSLSDQRDVRIEMIEQRQRKAVRQASDTRLATLLTNCKLDLDAGDSDALGGFRLSDLMGQDDDD